MAVAMASSSSPLLQLIAFSLLLLHLPFIAPAALRPETCSSSDPPCQAIIGYVTPANIALSRIDLLFSVNWTTIVSFNDFDLSTPDLADAVVPASKLLRIPQTCGCVNKQRVVTSVNYTVVSGNTLSTIASQYYSNLVTYQEIGVANNISNVNMIFVGQSFAIPIPCACRNGTDEGHAAQFVTYPVQNGDELSKIATDYNTTASDLENINGLNSSSLQAASIMFVPLQVCKAKFSGKVIDKNLTVAEGSYALTANNCVQCSCSNGTLYCSPTPAAIGSSCSNVTCASSKLTLGADSTKNRSSGGCTVKSCVYNGYTSAGIKTKLESTVDPTCPASPPPPSLYKPPSGLAASPLGSTTPTVSGPPTPGAPPSTPTVAAPPATADASSIVVGVIFSWVLTLGVTLWLNSLIPCSVL